MDALSADAKKEFVRSVFPELRFGGDPDIERYFELRRDGRMAQALAIYNGPLRARYPGDAARVTLLKLYRENDPRYPLLQAKLVMDLADALARRVVSAIDAILAPLERADLSNAIGALKAVEALLARLPGEIDDAVAALARYEAFARVLRHKASLAGRALELLREYEAVSKADSPADYDFIARSAAIEERRRAVAARERGGARAGGARGEDRYDFVARSAEAEERRKNAEKSASKRLYFDPARIRFSAYDRARVEIPASLSRREDKVLAFCAKYWNNVRDPGFERLVFLYSRKFGTRHFEVFRAVKLGRLRGHSDDDILGSVSSLLSQRYEYSVSGDVYMQVVWRRLKARMEANAIAARLASPGPESRTRSRAPISSAAPSAAPLTAPSAAPLAAPRAAPKAAPLTAPRAAPRTEPGRASTATGKAATGAASEAAHKAALKAAPAAPKATVQTAQRAASGAAPRRDPKAPGPAAHIASPAIPKAPALARPSQRGARPLAPRPAAPEPLPELARASGSISDRIRKLSGRPYDVYRDIFLEKVRDSIRKTLMANQTRSHGLFDTAANDAEDRVFEFMHAHYDDPYMDWERSAERSIVESLGFDLPSLAPIIESCYKRL